jgi:hypothetical protein
MKFTILVSNLKVISPSVFSWKKKNTVYKKLQCNSVKIRFSRKKILNYAYVLKNGVGRYNICRCLILLHPVRHSMFTRIIFIHSYDLHSDLIRYSICTCVKLFAEKNHMNALLDARESNSDVFPSFQAIYV